MLVLFMIFLMVVIGGFIGVMMNYIVIWMFFCFYKVIYLFNKCLLFILGLIFKWCDELVEYIGKVVVSYLFIEDVICVCLLDENL